MIPDILAERYASKEIKQIWSAEGKILLERDLWIAVMKAQKELGLDIPQEAIDAYERVKNNIRIDEINKREKSPATTSRRASRNFAASPVLSTSTRA